MRRDVGAIGAGLAVGGVVAGRTWRRRARRADDERVREQAVVDALRSGAPDGNRSVLIVMGALNEASTIGAVLAGLPMQLLGRPVRVVVVDDGSTDATAETAAAAGAVVVRHSRNLGQGDALRTGCAVALADRAEVVVTMDADGQHDPAELISLVGPVLDGRADYVQGSRFLGTYDDRASMRAKGILLLTQSINVLSGTAITDCANGYRAISADGLRRMQLVEGRYSASEIIMEAHHRGLRMLEVPVHIRHRVQGESRKPRLLRYPLGYVRVMVTVRLRQAFRPRPRTPRSQDRF